VQARSSPGAPGSGAPRILFAFAAGLIAVLIGREPALWLLAAGAAALPMPGAGHLAATVPAYATDPVTPLGLPRLLVVALVGALWGIVLARVVRRDTVRSVRLAKALLFGAIVPTIAAALATGALPWHRLEPGMAWGAIGLALIPEILANAAWGVVAIAILDQLLGGRRALRPAPAVAPRRR
jgi:hypothetical protein